MELLAYGDSGWGDELFFATLMTLAVAVTAMFIGFIFSLIFTPLKIANNKILNFIGNFYTTVIRGVPELLVIYLFFFGGSNAVMYVAKIFGYDGYIEIITIIYGFDYYNPPEEIRNSGRLVNDNQEPLFKDLWELRSKKEWNAIRNKTGILEIATPDSWAIDLEKRYTINDSVIYSLE